MVDYAKEVGADAVSHGCTGKGNDQVCVTFRFHAGDLFPFIYLDLDFSFCKDFTLLLAFCRMFVKSRYLFRFLEVIICTWT